MAFMIHSTDDHRVPHLEYHSCGAIQPKIGLALVMTGGNLAIATGTAKPTYLSHREDAAARAAGDIIPVTRVQPDTVYETTFAVAAADVKVGNKVTIHTDGMQVTATTTNGVAEIVAMEGTAAGDKCWVRFV